MRWITRGVTTLVGAAVAGFLVWLAVRMGVSTEGDYWATYGLVAAAGLVMALSQLLGGWTKWGWPRVDLPVFLIGFLPVFVAGGWVLLARQPGSIFFNSTHVSRDIGIDSLVSDLGDMLAVIAFGIGLTFGFTFDTAPRAVPAEAPAAPRPARVPVDRAAADEPVTAERRSIAEADEMPAEEQPVRQPNP